MVWNEATREHYNRSHGGYDSDTTDEEWTIIEPLLPKQGRMGRPRKWDIRHIFDAIQYVLATGCQWRMLPHDFPPSSTVANYYYAWRDSGVFDRMMSELRASARVLVGRNVNPSAGIIDSQSVKTCESGGPRGYDAGKKVNGRKRHIIVDTEGFPLAMEVHKASIQDRDGAILVIEELNLEHPLVATLFADGGYSGAKLRNALEERGMTNLLEIVRKPKDQVGFSVLPRRWVVERTFAWLNRCRRLSKDLERTIASSRAWMILAACRFMTRRIARGTVSRL